MARVKGLLKAALRTWGLRCLSVRDVAPRLPPQPTPPAPHTSQHAGGAADCVRR
jgi:hypothetical protein